MTLGVGLLLFTLVFRDAGYSQRVRMGVDDRVKSMTAGLSLTQAQADGVRKIYQAEEQERNKLFDTHQGDRSSLRESMGKITKGVDEKIKALLTDEQKVKYGRIKQQRPRNGRPPDRRKQGA